MSDDREGQNDRRGPGRGSQETGNPQEIGPVWLTPKVPGERGGLAIGRREAIAAIAVGAVASAPAAKAQHKGGVEIRLIRNPLDHSEIGVGIEFTRHVDVSGKNVDGEKVGVALYPRLFGGQVAPTGKTRGVDSRMKLDRFGFPEMRFADGRSYGLQFEYHEDGAISGAIRRGGGWGNACYSKNKVPLQDLLNTETERPQGLQFPLTEPQLRLFAADLFGEQLVVSRGGGTLTVFLTFPKATPDAMLRRPQVYAPSEPEFWMSLLPDKPDGLLSLEGAVSIKRLEIRRTAADKGDGAQLQIEQETARIGKAKDTKDSRAADPSRYRARAWVGTARGPGALNDPAREIPDFVFYGFPREAAKATAFSLRAGANPTRFSLRQWGERRHTVAVLRSPLDVSLPAAESRDGRRPAFRLSDALFMRQRPLPSKNQPIDQGIVETLTGRLDDKPFVVETAYGGFVVHGEPPPDPEARQGLSNRRLDRLTDFPLRPAKGLTQFHLKAQDGRLVAFDARALLTHIGVELPNAVKKEDEEKAPVVREEGGVWSRLDFRGTEIAFRLPLPGPWPSAAGIVTLGEAPQAPADFAGDHLAARVSIPLDGAALRVRRDRDNLALAFGFSNMLLELAQNSARIVPNLAARGGSSAKVDSSATGKGSFDTRPLLIVEFPPQHVAEKAYYRQINDGIVLPDIPLAAMGGADFTRRLRKWRKTADKASKLKQRTELFRELENHAKKPEADDKLRQILALVHALQQPLTYWPPPPQQIWLARVATSENVKQFWAKIPEDQRLYLGTSADAMDPDVRRNWLSIWRIYLDVGRTESKAAFEQVRARLPDDEIPPANGRPQGGAPTAELAARWAQRSAEFAELSRKYERYKDPMKPRPPVLPAKYEGREAIKAAWEGANDANKSKIVEFLNELMKPERFDKVTPTRLSGPSRLVFRFDSTGGSFDDRDPGKRSTVSEDDARTRSIEFSLEALTDWGRFDLAVARRAETLESFPSGRMPHPDARRIDLDTSRILAHQGIHPGRSLEGRLDDIRTSLRPPTDRETAIELPFRLYLSPNQFGRFRTRRPVLAEVLQSKQAGIPEQKDRLSLLWSANLELDAANPAVRAIWSDDFRPGALTGSGDPPTHSIMAPWSKPGVSFRTGLDALDRHEIVGLSSVYGLPVMGRRDFRQRLVDASQVDPPPGYRLKDLKFDERDESGKLDLNAIYNPASLDISELRLTALGGSLRHDSSFVPPASALREKDGSKLFQAFSVERWRQITVLGRDIEVEVVYKGFLFPLGVRAALVKLTERRITRNDKTGFVSAILIQRKFIRISRPKKEFPALGHPDRGRRFPVSELTMLTRETPDIVDPDLDDPPQGLTQARVLASGRIGLALADRKAKQEGRCFWPRTRPGTDGDIAFEFMFDSEPTRLRRPLVFVDNTAANDPATMAALVRFYNGDNSAEYHGGAPFELRRLPMGGVRRRYADENQDGECQFETLEWELRAEGRAGGPAPAPSDTKNDTAPPNNNLFASDPWLQGADQPPFYPFVHRARIAVGQAERFVGRALPPHWVQFDHRYVWSGFPPADPAPAADGKPPPDPKTMHGLESYLRFEDPLKLDMGEGGDRSGGIGRPAIEARFISRRYGLLGHSEDKSRSSPPAATTTPAASAAPAAAPPPDFDLKSFFSDDAKLLGILSFRDIIKFLLETQGSSAIPELKEKVDAATEETAAFLRQTVLPEIQAALVLFDEMLETARKALEKAAREAGQARSIDVDALYPDVGPALAALRASVNRATAAGPGDLVVAVNEMQSAGRRLVAAIGRSLSDPVAPLREELRKKLQALKDPLGSLAETLRGQVDTSITAAKTEFRKEVASKLAAEYSVIAGLIFSLPVPDDALPVAPPGIPRIDDALIKGAEKTLQTLLDVSGLGSASLAAAFAAGLKAASDSLPNESGLSKYKDYAKELLEKYGGAADTEDALLAEVTGIGFPVVRKVVAPLVAWANRLKSTTAASAVEDIAAVHVFLEHLAALLAELSKDACADLVSKVVDLSRAVLAPDEFDLNKLLVGLDKVLADLGADQNVLAPLKNRYVALAKRLDGNWAAGICTENPQFENLQSAIAALRKLPEVKQAIDAVVLKALGGDSVKANANLLALVNAVKAFTGAADAKTRIEALKKAIKELAARTPKPRFLETRLNGLMEQVEKAGTEIGKVKDAFEALEKELAEDNIGAEGVRDRLDTIFRIMREVEALPVGLLGDIAISGEAARKTLFRASSFLLVPLFGALQKYVYGPVGDVEKKLRELSETKNDGSDRRAIFEWLGSIVPRRRDLAQFMTGAQARLAEENAQLASLRKSETYDSKYEDDLAALTGKWARREAAPILLLGGVTDVLAAILKGDLAQLVDLQEIRRQVDAAIRKMVPARISRSYDLKLKLPDEFKGMVFFGKTKKIEGLPRAHPAGLPSTLVLRATGVVDLMEPQRSTAEARGYLPGFALNLLPGFDVATFMIPPSSFTAGPGKPMQLDLKVENVVLGEKVQFLKKLESILPAPKDGKGFYIRPMTGRGFGLVAGYVLPFSAITIGNMYIDNLSLNIAAELPFGNDDARFVIGIARPEAPFMISVAPYAGAGHLALIANPKGFVGVEASFQFGGGGGFSFGPLTGSGRISVGIFVRKLKDQTELYGVFYAGGSARIACFGVGAHLNVRMNQQDGNLEGSAIFTYSFSMGIKDIEFSVTVFKRENGSGSDSKKSGAGKRSRRRRRQGPGWAPFEFRPAVLKNQTSCKSENFEVYRSYFGEPRSSAFKVGGKK